MADSVASKQMQVGFQSLDRDILGGTNQVKLFSGKSFLFHIGSEANNVSLWCHENVFATVSEPLHAMMISDMKEGRSGKVVLSDVDPHMFAALIEYAYRGHIKHSILGLERDESSLRFYVDQESLGTTLTQWWKLEPFDDFDLLGQDEFGSWYKDLRGMVVVDSFLILFYCKVITIANKYLLLDLEEKATSLLHDTLAATIHNTRLSLANVLLNVVDGIIHDENILPNIRTMVILWVAGSIETIKDLPALRLLMEESPQFTIELCDIMARHIKPCIKKPVSTP